MKNKQQIALFIILAILLIAGTYFVTSFYLDNQVNLQKEQCNSQVNSINSKNEQNINFFREYSIALNNIHVGTSYTDIARVNLHKLNDYVSSNDTRYIYIFAEDIANLGKEQATESKDYLIKAKNKLETIKNNAPNNFFKEDVSNRIEQTDALITYADQTYNLLDYSIKQLYEINYGSKSTATEYWNKYNALILELNSNLKKLSDIQNRIDLNWDQDWYPTFQE
jgi:hypothetical protein